MKKYYTIACHPSSQPFRTPYAYGPLTVYIPLRTVASHFFTQKDTFRHFSTLLYLD